VIEASAVSWPVVTGLVVLLSAVQSVFGVGLLVFGTPMLLLLGLPFSQVLMLLLPCSITVSALQVATTGGFKLDPMRRRFLVITVPAVGIATLAALTWGSPSHIRLVVGAMLIVSALLRVGGARRGFDAGVQRHQGPLLLLLGLVHGASNLGGGLLATLVGASYQESVMVRRQIAFCYGAMASIQILVLLSSGDRAVSAMSLVLPLLAAATYFSVGQRVFRRAGHFGYQFALSVMIFGVGMLLVAT
jgi:hypothetical protein